MLQVKECGWVGRADADAAGAVDRDPSCARVVGVSVVAVKELDRARRVDSDREAVRREEGRRKRTRCIAGLYKI